MRWTLQHSLISTLAYASLFGYPLTKQEIYTWLITDAPVPLEEISNIKKISFYKTYTSLEKIRSLSEQRILHEAVSRKKWVIAKKVAHVLSFIPTIQLIGVSGGLSMNNVDEQDDIDFFLIVNPKTVWITRLIVISILQLLGKRRKIYDKDTKDKICTNMFVDTNQLCLSKKEQDLYSAHEVLQMVPLVDKNNTYQKFIFENSWVKNYLYNAWKEKSRKQLPFHNALPIVASIYTFFDMPAKYFQLWYMKNHRTTEVVSDTVLRFHPRDTRIFIRQNYLKLLKKYNIPLDRSFFQSLQ